MDAIRMHVESQSAISRNPQFNYLADKLFQKTCIYADKSLEFWNSCFFSGCYWDVRFLSQLCFLKTLYYWKTAKEHIIDFREHSLVILVKKIHWGSDINLRHSKNIKFCWNFFCDLNLLMIFKLNACFNLKY